MTEAMTLMASVYLVILLFLRRVLQAKISHRSIPLYFDA